MAESDTIRPVCNCSSETEPFHGSESLCIPIHLPPDEPLHLNKTGKEKHLERTVIHHPSQ